MKKLIVLLILIIAAVSMCSGDDKKSKVSSVTGEDRYSGPWNRGTTVEISRTLVAKRVGECGWMEWKPASDSNHEFMVRCTKDGNNWIYYLVFTKINDVVGPAKTPAFK